MFVSEISCALCVNDTFVLLPHLHVHIVVGAQCKRGFTISCMIVVSQARIFALIQHHRHIRPFLLSFGHLSKCNQCTLFKSLIQMQIGRIEDTFYEMNLCFMAHSTVVFFSFEFRPLILLWTRISGYSLLLNFLVTVFFMTKLTSSFNNFEKKTMEPLNTFWNWKK